MGTIPRSILFSVLVLSCAVVVGLSLPEKARQVTVGTTGTVSDIGIYIAHSKGYFREEGLEVKLTERIGGTVMLDSLKRGQIDVGGAIASPSLYNAVANGAFKIVADKGSLAPMQNHHTLLVRSDLVKTSRFKSLSDLKGLNIAVPAIPDSVASARLNVLLEAAGISWGDVTVFNGALPQHALAFERREIDAALTTEPISSHIVARGLAVRVNQADLIYQSQQAGTLLYSDRFIAERRLEGEKFMRAYLRGVREFHAGLVNGRLTGAKGEEIIQIITSSTAAKDASVFRSFMLPANNPNGEVNFASLEKDLDFFKEQNWVHDPSLDIAQIVDRSFAVAATQEIGRYGFTATISQVRKTLRTWISG